MSEGRTRGLLPMFSLRLGSMKERPGCLWVELVMDSAVSGRDVLQGKWWHEETDLQWGLDPVPDKRHFRLEKGGQLNIVLTKNIVQ